MSQNILDDPQKIKEIDLTDMLGAVARFPDMLEAAMKIKPEGQLPHLDMLESIVVVGMGGSAIGGDIVRMVMSDYPVFVVRNYNLPKYINKNSLIFVVSYSGNTEETLSVFGQASAKGLPIIAVTSGGKLKQLSQVLNIPVMTVPSGTQPRAALPYLLAPVLLVLEKYGIISNIRDALQESIGLLKNLREKYTGSVPLKKNLAKQIADKLKDKIPVVFSSVESTEAAGLRFKDQLNENSKVTAVYDVFAELNHNQIVNLGELKKGQHHFSLLLLRDQGDHKRIQKRIDITRDLLKQSIADVFEIYSEGHSHLSRLLSLIYIGDYISVYLAILRRFDPSPVKTIEALKKQLRGA